MEKVRPWCGQPSDRGRLRNRTEPLSHLQIDFLSQKKCCQLLGRQRPPPGALLLDPSGARPPDLHSCPPTLNNPLPRMDWAERPTHSISQYSTGQHWQQPTTIQQIDTPALCGWSVTLGTCSTVPIATVHPSTACVPNNILYSTTLQTLLSTSSCCLNGHVLWSFFRFLQAKCHLVT